MRPLRVTSVPYLNAAPLTWGFSRADATGAVDLALEPPARIAARLRSGRTEVGLIPAIDYQRLEDVEILPGLCVASKHRARSVFLASRLPIEKVTSVALDENSSTSAALCRLILAHRGASGVSFSAGAPPLADMLRAHDAALIIGDAALTADTSGLRVYDLAAEWLAITRLPFVFAVWAARPGADLPGGVEPFEASRRAGLAHIDAIAREAAPALRLPAASLADYLRVNIHYDLGPEEIRGMDLFFRQALELGLVPRLRPLRLREAAGGFRAAAEPRTA